MSEIFIFLCFVVVILALLGVWENVECGKKPKKKKPDRISHQTQAGMEHMKATTLKSQVLSVYHEEVTGKVLLLSSRSTRKKDDIYTFKTQCPQKQPTEGNVGRVGVMMLVLKSVMSLEVYTGMPSMGIVGHVSRPRLCGCIVGSGSRVVTGVKGRSHTVEK